MKLFAHNLALILVATCTAQAQFNVTVTYLYPPKNPGCPAHMQGTTDTQQVGGMAGFRAVLWSGSSTGIDLTPPGYYESWAYAIAAGQQAGYAVSNTAVIHAGIWSGSAGSWVDLNPAGASTSEA